MSEDARHDDAVVDDHGHGDAGRLLARKGSSIRFSSFGTSSAIFFARSGSENAGGASGFTARRGALSGPRASSPAPARQALAARPHRERGGMAMQRARSWADLDKRRHIRAPHIRCACADYNRKRPPRIRWSAARRTSRVACDVGRLPEHLAALDEQAEEEAREHAVIELGEQTPSPRGLRVDRAGGGGSRGRRSRGTRPRAPPCRRET